MSRGRAGRPPRRGLVLGAGGVLGAAWTIGALKALEEVEGFDPGTVEVLVGTSAGSVLATLLGSGLTPDALLHHQQGVVVEGETHLVYDHDANGPLPPRPRLGIGSRGLLVRTALHPRSTPPLAALYAMLPAGRGSLKPIGRLVHAVTPAGPWSPHPSLWVVALDYDGGHRVVFGQDGAPGAHLSEAVMASCSVPGWYAPVDIAGRRYVDGGTWSSTSLDLLSGLGLDEVYVLAPMASFRYDRPDSVVARLERRWRRRVTRRLLREAELVRASGTDVTMVGPGPEDLSAIGANLMDPRRRTQVLETSLRTSVSALRRSPLEDVS
ncbi:MAG: patatin-like phospholipase family protein [Actinomycetes bacterium]